MALRRHPLQQDLRFRLKDVHSLKIGPFCAVEIGPGFVAPKRSGNRNCADLTLWADCWLGRELQRLLQDVLEGGVPLGTLKRRESIQQLVHKDAKTPPTTSECALDAQSK